ncbi:PTTG1 interacting protein b [Synchiropus picturatus]
MFADHRSIIWTLISVFVLAHAQTPSSAPDPVTCESRSNTSCDQCLQNVSCLWCNANSRCLEYPVKNILPSSSVCSLTEARWGLCQINLQILIISMCVIGGVIIVALLVCCFCCCKCEKIGNRREDARAERQHQERSSRQKAKRTEMQLRHDEIRQKYGLAKNNAYTRMSDK